ncbi:Hypothetical predicted protein, partial [Scomber scombrus]
RHNELAAGSVDLQRHIKRAHLSAAVLKQEVEQQLSHPEACGALTQEVTPRWERPITFTA